MDVRVLELAKNATGFIATHNRLHIQNVKKKKICIEFVTQRKNMQKQKQDQE